MEEQVGKLSRENTCQQLGKILITQLNNVCIYKPLRYQFIQYHRPQRRNSQTVVNTLSTVSSMNV